jgi:lambda repressor-like predicted transcriptional regulator
MNKWLKIGAIAGAAVLGVAALGIAASSLMPLPVSAQVVNRALHMGQSMAQFGPRGGNFGGPGDFAGRGGPGGFGGPGGNQVLLAEALGITPAELQLARERAHIAAIQQAVDEELITQTQADQMLLGGGPGFRGGPMDEGFGRGGQRGPAGGPARFGADIDPQALFAQELGITVEELEAAQAEAQVAAIQKAVEAGTITQEQADMMLAHMNLREYRDQDALMASALGITVEDVQAARDEGKDLVTLVDELGLDAATVRLALTTARQEAIQQAVSDGVITQEQADQVTAGPGPGFGGPMGPPMGGPRGGGKGHGGPGGFGGFGGNR